MASIVDICNKALSLLGQNSIVSLDDNSAEAYACRTHWKPLQEEILAGHPWNCVSNRFTLSRLVETPEFGYKYFYQLPVGCLRINETVPSEEYEIRGNRVLTDAETFAIDCVVVTDNTDIYSPELCAGLAHLLASELCVPMTSSVSNASRLYDLGNDKIRNAKATNAFQGKKRNNNQTTWLKAKLG